MIFSVRWRIPTHQRGDMNAVEHVVHIQLSEINSEDLYEGIRIFHDSWELERF